MLHSITLAVSGLSISFLNEVGDGGVGVAQRLLIRQKDDAEMPRAGFLSEAGAVDDHDVFLADEFFDENFIILLYVDARKGVEGATRSDATEARRGLAPVLREIAAEAQFALHFEEVILRALECGLDGILFGMVGAEAGAQQ